jgi:hypothetical protein
MNTDPQGQCLLLLVEMDSSIAITVYGYTEVNRGIFKTLSDPECEAAEKI